MSNVSIVGLGYVGLPLALLASKKGHSVVGIDLDENKVAKINKHQPPMPDDYIIKWIKNSDLVAVSDFNPVKKSDIVIVCVPTPVKDGYIPDLTPLKSAVTGLAQNLQKDTLVVIESTINPGVCDEIVIPTIEEISGLKVNKDFFVAHCPERINPGDKKWNVENIPRVIGASNAEGLNRAQDFYESIVDARIKPMTSLKEAESVKIVENSFRDVNIAFVNELARSFTKLGVNVKNVIDGAATKPFAFMPHYPSIGVGGHCIPVDPYYLIEYARGYGFEHEFLTLARTINNGMPEFTVERLIDALNEVGQKLKGSTVAVLGLAYKPDVADDRESPSYKVIKILKTKGAKVKTYDPYFLQRSSEKNLESALKGSDAVILAVNHSEFLNIDYSKYKIKALVDGKNCLDATTLKKSGLVYRGIGVQ